jgi:hypothetical protein
MNLRRKLVKVTCVALMHKTNSTRPSTDQRRQLAECIVDQLYPYMSSSERLNLQVSRHIIFMALYLLLNVFICIGSVFHAFPNL